MLNLRSRCLAASASYAVLALRFRLRLVQRMVLILIEYRYLGFAQSWPPLSSPFAVACGWDEERSAPQMREERVAAVDLMHESITPTRILLLMHSSWPAPVRLILHLACDWLCRFHLICQFRFRIRHWKWCIFASTSH